MARISGLYCLGYTLIIMVPVIAFAAISPSLHNSPHAPNAYRALSDNRTLSPSLKIITKTLQSGFERDSAHASKGVQPGATTRPRVIHTHQSLKKIKKPTRHARTIKRRRRRRRPRDSSNQPVTPPKPERSPRSVQPIRAVKKTQKSILAKKNVNQKKRLDRVSIIQKPHVFVGNSLLKPAKAYNEWKNLRQEARFCWPLNPREFWISSSFGPRRNPNGRIKFHAGVDLAAIRGTCVYAAGEGIVIEAAYVPGYGNYIMIAHNNGFKTRYAHLDKILVKVGQKVIAGAHIGRVGATGFVRKSKWGGSGSHLHFEVYKKRKPVHPFYFLA